MLSKLTPVLTITILLFLSCSVLCDICSLSFCQCEDSDVSCQGEGKELLDLSSSSLPSSINILNLSNLASVTIKTNTFSGQEKLKEINLKTIEKVVLKKFSYSTSKVSTNMTHFKIENIKHFSLETGHSLDNFPRSSLVVIKKVGMETVPAGGLKLSSETVQIEDCDIEKLASESVDTDCQTFNFINNKVRVIETKAFSGNSNIFNFSGNDIGKIESNAMNVQFLSSVMSRNTFHSSSSSSPLLSLSPSPACVPDDTAYDYGDIETEYRIVASPALTFQANYFPQFSLAMLQFPAIRNIPLGSLTISSNSLPCDCHTIKKLALLADFDHLDLLGEDASETEFGNLVFQKEFYSTANCVLDNGKELRLKKFARSWLEVTETGLKCTDPEERKQRITPERNLKSDTKSASDAKSSLLADQPHTEKVKKEKVENMSDFSNNIPSKIINNKSDSLSATSSTGTTFLVMIFTLIASYLKM